MIKIIKQTTRVFRSVILKETHVDYKANLRSFIGTFIGVGLIVFVQKDILSKNDHFFLIAPLGASGVLLYGAPQSPFAQPRNLIGGHLISALIGVTIQQILPNTPLIAAPLAVSSSILFMQITRTLHPPGGATALIAIIGSKKVKLLGYMFIVNPVLTGALVLLFVALIINNLTSDKQYPTDGSFTLFLKRVFPKSKKDSFSK